MQSPSNAMARPQRFAGAYFASCKTWLAPHRGAVTCYNAGKLSEKPMAELTTVFLSSTAKDLQPYRDAVVEAIGKLAGFHCTRMEDFGAVDGEPLAVCRRRVAESEVFVGLVG